MKNTGKVHGACGVARPRVLLFAGGVLLLLALGLVILQMTHRLIPFVDNGSPNHQTSQAPPQSNHTEEPQDHRTARTPTVSLEKGVTPTEETISKILRSGRPIDQMASDLLLLFPDCQGATQTLVASHLSHLTEASQANQLVSFLSDQRINRASKEEIFSSIYQHEPLEVAALLIQVLEEGASEFANEAEQGLSILLEANHGKDVSAWKLALEAQKQAKGAK
jgi:hypothetical protein